MAAAYLGLAARSHTRDNAHNFAVFAFCIYHIELQCLGTFQSDVKRRRDLPFESALSPKAVERIRQGKSDLRRDITKNTDRAIRSLSQVFWLRTTWKVEESVLSALEMLMLLELCSGRLTICR